MLPVLLTLLASAPEVAILSTPADAETTELRFQRPGAAEPSPAVASFMHVKGSAVWGALLPGTRAVLAVAQTKNYRDSSWAAGLVRLEAGKPAVTIAERIAISTRPFITRDGRVFVQRGREGEGRVDHLSIDEIDPRSGAARTVHAFDGYTTAIVGAFEGELVVYRVTPNGADLVAVHRDALGVRVLCKLAPMARDFAIDGRSLYFTTADAEGWLVARVDLRTGAFTPMKRSAEVTALPTVIDGRLAVSPGAGEGLRFVDDGTLALLPHGPTGFERVLHQAGGLACVRHEIPSSFPAAYAVELKTGKTFELAAPRNVHLELAGVVE